MTAHDDIVLSVAGLGKRYGRKWGLRECTFSLPRGRVSALVGPNGAGKSTLLRLIVGLSRPTTGQLTLFGDAPSKMTRSQLSRIAYLDQERPLYKTLRVKEILRVGRSMNPRWDDDIALGYLSGLGIDLTSKVNELSIGQQAQVSLSVCLAKQPELLLLDEPCAALDPLARQQLMRTLMDSVKKRGTTVILSSHVIADFEDSCDHLTVVSASRVLLADDLSNILSQHKIAEGTNAEMFAAPRDSDGNSLRRVGQADRWLVHTGRESADPAWIVTDATLEDVVLGYLGERVFSTLESVR
ncbi:MAG: ABC transporter ATP-binding protein [Acidimicrobiales bacterium]